MDSLRKRQIQLSTPIKLPSLFIHTPLSCHEVRRLLKMSPSIDKDAILARAVLRLATQYEIQNHKNNSLRRAIVEEKKRRQRGKRLNLVGEECGPEPQFFSPIKVLQAKAFQDTKEAQKEKEAHIKALRKEEAV